MNARTKTVYNQLNTGWLTRLDPRLPVDQYRVSEISSFSPPHAVPISEHRRKNIQ